ncbi:MAG: hypothetical protein K2L96_07285 [Muribaculaceae bacterium]|nr:hypothetical protein [Muribaculaceae bacterium]
MEFDILYPEKEESLHNAECIVAATYFYEDELIDLGVPKQAYEVKMPFSDLNEFEKAFKLWESPLYLKKFYNDNLPYFEQDYWKGITAAEFIQDVTHSINQIKAEFMNLFSNNQLHTIVEPLDCDDEARRLHQSIRVKIKQGWIHRRLAFRFYAVEIEEDKCYLITGAAIKVHKDMMKAPNTSIEKAKLDAVLRDLDTKRIDTKESFINYITTS